ncbi:Transcriptional activator spt7 [Ascosphaera aggregata]|nr:Transcriptional activator spt7 [Ascosphaera aggregata]
MTKKLKNMVYKSKKEFVDDLNLIWANCLKYNTNPDHPLRKHAHYMRKVAEELKPMIPDVVVRDRAEVEAEERRLQMADLDGAEESDDEPIMTSRGRKAVGKGSRKGKGVGARAAATRSAVTTEEVQTPVPEAHKDDSQGQSQNQFQNRPPSTAPLGSDFQSEVHGSPPSGSSIYNDGLEGIELDPYGPAMSAAVSNLSRPIIDFENPEYKMWKQVTQKGRAKVTAERHRLFKGDKLNTDEPALLRTKAGMRRWLRGKLAGVENSAEGLQSTSASGASNASRPATTSSLAQNAPTTTGETLAENMDQDGNRVLPDYYDVMSAVPDIPEQLRWVEDSEGNVVDMCEDYLTMLPKGLFVQPPSKFARKMDANMRQMQETRKICSKVSIVKQMQVQSQMYQNQFQKYNPEPFVEKDVHPHVMNHLGPVISPWTARAALQRSVGKIFYSAGFEEFQPSALDAVTDIAADFFQRISGTLKAYMEVPRVSTDDEDAPVTVKSNVNGEKTAKATTSGTAALETAKLKRPRKAEDMILHTLNAVGMEPETLEGYVKDDIERIGTKLGQLHERLKSHLAELLRPAFHDDSGDGSAMFNDGSEQFIGGDFAEDIDEDFFGFKELGLDQEFGGASLTVPLHLLQNRMYMSHQAQNPAAATGPSAAFPTPPKYPPITMENVSKQIGPVQKFLMAKLRKNGERPLVEDLDLPPKQRPNPVRPRLPATGKIAPMAAPVLKSDNTASPAKRPAPLSLSKKDTASPSKKKAKKSVAVGRDNGDTGKKE